MNPSGSPSKDGASSLDSPGKKSEQKVKRRRPKNYSKQEIGLLLRIIKEDLPLSGTEWERSLEKFHDEGGTPSRDVASIKRKYSSFVAMSRPTGNPSCDWEVRCAKEIDQLMYNKSEQITGQTSEEEFGEDEPTDDPVQDVNQEVYRDIVADEGRNTEDMIEVSVIGTVAAESSAGGTDRGSSMSLDDNPTIPTIDKSRNILTRKRVKMGNEKQKDGDVMTSYIKFKMMSDEKDIERERIRLEREELKEERELKRQRHSEDMFKQESKLMRDQMMMMMMSGQPAQRINLPAQPAQPEETTIRNDPPMNQSADKDLTGSHQNI